MTARPTRPRQAKTCCNRGDSWGNVWEVQGTDGWIIDFDPVQNNPAETSGFLRPVEDAECELIHGTVTRVQILGGGRFQPTLVALDPEGVAESWNADMNKASEAYSLPLEVPVNYGAQPRTAVRKRGSVVKVAYVVEPPQPVSRLPSAALPPLVAAIWLPRAWAPRAPQALGPARRPRTMVWTSSTGSWRTPGRRSPALTRLTTRGPGLGASTGCTRSRGRLLQVRQAFPAPCRRVLHARTLSIVRTASRGQQDRVDSKL